MRFRQFVSLTVWFLFVSAAFSHAQTEKEYNIAVLDLEARGLEESESKSLSDFMRGQVTRFVTSPGFVKKSAVSYTVVERTQMDKIFEQFQIQDTGCTDVTCAVEFGKMLNVEKIIIGTVGLVGGTYTISVRIVDVETTKIIAVADYVFTGVRDNLITTGIPNVVSELLTGKKQAKSSKKKYYILGGIVLAGGIVAATLNGGSDGGGSDGSINVTVEFPE